jgi:hypothetical protein
MLTCVRPGGATLRSWPVPLQPPAPTTPRRVRRDVVERSVHAARCSPAAGQPVVVALPWRGRPRGRSPLPRIDDLLIGGSMLAVALLGALMAASAWSGLAG